ncbi:MAG: hypothetical protein ACYDGY_04775 [Acidimicrobiales bacterium]
MSRVHRIRPFSRNHGGVNRFRLGNKSKNSMIGDTRSAVENRLRQSLQGRSELLSPMLPLSPSDDIFGKILRGIGARRDKKRKVALTTAGSFAAVLVVAGVAATSAGLLGFANHTSQNTHAAAVESARPGTIASQLMHASRPACAAGTINGKSFTGCTGIITTYPADYNGASRLFAANAGPASIPQGRNGLTAEPAVPTCTSSFMSRIGGHGLDTPTVSHQANQAKATLIPGEYLEVALAPLTESNNWVLATPARPPASTGNASAPSYDHATVLPVLSLCTIRSPVAGGMVIVATAIRPGVQTITAYELAVIKACSAAGSHGTASHGTGSARSTSHGTKSGVASRKCTAANPGGAAYQAATYSLKVVVNSPPQVGNGTQPKTG